MLVDSGSKLHRAETASSLRSDDGCSVVLAPTGKIQWECRSSNSGLVRGRVMCISRVLDFSDSFLRTSLQHASLTLTLLHYTPGRPGFQGSRWHEQPLSALV
ncbi:uncharacterized protein TrAFT101_000525 [Trichoderma asperellum]|uniref:uncharacterized protein n=1 Tax=Trichoderma asperellum TaxID=101201 RepID=UPI00331DFD8B|nr:hypothetical protein TrAFT101_000525 [Trichoderma asperellum]